METPDCGSVIRYEVVPVDLPWLVLNDDGTFEISSNDETLSGTSAEFLIIGYADTYPEEAVATPIQYRVNFAAPDVVFNSPPYFAELPELEFFVE